MAITVSWCYSFKLAERRRANAYKTALCQTYRSTGACEYGEDCRFAHSEAELRLPPQVGFCAFDVSQTNELILFPDSLEKLYSF